MKKRNSRKYLLLISIGLFLVGTVFFAIEAATSGSEVASLEKKEAVLIQENQELSDKIIEASSLSSIEKKAPELDFAKPGKVVYIGPEETIAKVP